MKKKHLVFFRKKTRKKEKKRKGKPGFVKCLTIK
jgi:hypothetical protein